MMERPQRDAKKRDYYIKKHVYPQVMTGVQAMELLLKNDEFRPPVQYMFFDRDFLICNDLQFRKGMIHEDELFTLQMLEKAQRVGQVPFRLYHRRMHGASIMAGPKTARNYDGYYESFRWLHDGYIAGTPPLGKAMCEKNMIRLALCMAETYTCMPNAERKKAAGQKHAADQAMKSDRYFGSLRLRVLWTMQSANTVLRWMRSFYRMMKSAMPKGLRRIIRRVLKPAAYTKRKQAIESELHTTTVPKVVLMCTPEHGNLGDQAIAEISKQWLSRECAPLPVTEITINQYEQDARIVEQNIDKDDVLVICGGGWLGDLWFHNEVAVRRIIRQCKKNRIIVLPQTIYFSDDKQKKRSQAIYNAHPDLWLCLRDQASYRLITEGRFVQNADRVFYLPDMVLGFQGRERSGNRNGIAFCIRADKESVLDNASVRKLYAKMLEFSNEVPCFISTLTGTHITKETRMDALNAFFDTLAAKKLVVTDRLHCMLFCAVTGTPCIAFDNVSGKVSGSFAWIKGIPYIRLAKTTGDALAMMQEMLSGTETYTYPYDFSTSYHQIIQIIQQAHSPAANQKGHSSSGDN